MDTQITIKAPKGDGKLTMNSYDAKAMEATPAVKRAEKKKGVGYVRKRYGKYLLERVGYVRKRYGKYLLEIDGEYVKSNGDILKFKTYEEAEAVLMNLLGTQAPEPFCPSDAAAKKGPGNMPPELVEGPPPAPLEPEPGRQDPEPPADKSTDQSTEPPPPELHKPSQEQSASPEKEKENIRLCYIEGCNEPVHGRSNRCLKHCQERVRVFQAKNPKRIEAMRQAQTKAQELYRQWKAGNIVTREEALEMLFAADPEMLAKIRERAEKELRTVENQIVFMLRGNDEK